MKLLDTKGTGNTERFHCLYSRGSFNVLPIGSVNREHVMNRLRRPHFAARGFATARPAFKDRAWHNWQRFAARS